MPDDYINHGTNQTSENVIHVDWVTYSHQDYDAGVHDVRLYEVTYQNHTARGFTIPEALRRLADAVEGEMAPIDAALDHD